MLQPILSFLVAITLLNMTFAQQKDLSAYKKHFDPNHFEGKHRAQVSILGTFHFTNSDLHNYVDQYSVDALAEKRQAELKVLREHIAKFQPTKILIERNRISYDSTINAQYEAYLSGTWDAEENDEVYLIAFPLAKQLNLKKIHCSDARADWFGVDLDWENFDEEAYLKSRNQLEKASRYGYEQAYEIEDSLKSVLSLVDYFRLINDPQSQHFNHQVYITETVLSGAGDNYLGADSVARWYRRNLRIFSNVLDFTDFNQEERILIIYGASHIWTLKQFFKDSPDFEYVEINSFLDH